MRLSQQGILPLNAAAPLAGPGVVFLFELDYNLPDLNPIARLHPDVFDLAWERCGDIGFHFHGFDYQQQIVGLNLLSGLHVAADDNAGNGTAAYLRLIGNRFRACL